ncbi:glycosyltransferase family 4 protein [Lentzea guizhouensis]|uniref:glycosyltransferase family 4 protein n=1 Tax=Lentzea guizhouensis TaxID=1586287 RepID=UPI0014740C5A|nr:glycosyltransferase family 4 protein [Lentzea guizhouensis]
MSRVCVVSHRLGGFDGVSVEAAKWAGAFEELGWQVTLAAGHFASGAGVVVRGMWADRPGGEPPPVDHAVVKELCATHDLVVLDNAGSLWSAPEASVAWEEHALTAGVPVILRHHDPAWQRVQLRPVDGDVVPLHHPAHLHVLINSLTQREFLARWPQLHTEVVHNRVDVVGLAHGDRTGTRAALGVAPSDYLVVHPARVEGTSKNIPGAVEFVRRLSERRPDVRYWLTDDAPCPAAEQLPGVVRGRTRNPADLYAAADLVLLPSTWEGWGLPVCEAAAARKPVVAGPYPVLDEIRALGLTVVDPADLDGLLAVTDAVLDANLAAVRRHLDLRALPDVLTGLVEKAAGLSTGP